LSKERVEEEQRKVIVVCITGMPGAGKSTASSALRESGFEVYSMGDDIRAEAKRRGLSGSDEDLGKLMRQLREERGMAAIAEMCVQRIRKQRHENDKGKICIDGIRNYEEVLEFKKLGKVFLLAIHASPKRRYDFLKRRRRADAPTLQREFLKRDQRELDVGIGRVIALSDEVISNSVSVDALQTAVRQRVEDWLKKTAGGRC
jgi:dephospho-CoA kinase